MKISDSKPLPRELDQSPAGSPRNGAHKAADGAPISVTGLAGRLSKLEAELSAGAPAFDAAKVEAIKAAIQAGELKINPEAIADRLLADVEQLLRKPH